MQDKVFKAHPQLERYHKTSDGQPFYDRQDAKNHAKTLKDKTVKTVEKSAQLPVEYEEVKASKQEAKPKAETTKTSKPAAKTNKTVKASAKPAEKKGEKPEAEKTVNQETKTTDPKPETTENAVVTSADSENKTTTATNEADNKE